MRRALPQFVASFVLTFMLGGGATLLMAGLIPEQHDVVTTMDHARPDHEARVKDPGLTPELEAVAGVQMPPDEFVCEEAEKGWMPAYVAGHHDLTLHVQWNTPVSNDETLFRLAWSKYSPFPQEFLGGISGRTCGRTAAGEGIGYGLTVRARPELDGVLKISFGCDWKRAGNVRGEASTRLALLPDNLELGDKRRVKITDEATLTYWVTKPE